MATPFPLATLSRRAMLAGLGAGLVAGCSGQTESAPGGRDSAKGGPAHPVAVPFIISDEQARFFDGQLAAAPCGFAKASLSRYYWFDFMSTGKGFLVNPSLIRFILKEDGAQAVQALAQMPGADVMDGDDGTTVAVGEISNPDGRLERLDCWRKGPPGRRG